MVRRVSEGQQLDIDNEIGIKIADNELANLSKILKKNNSYICPSFFSKRSKLQFGVPLSFCKKKNVLEKQPNALSC